MSSIAPTVVPASLIAASDITLGILAGGRGMRLGQREKAWLRRDGISQVERWSQRFSADVASVLVSANRDLDRFHALGLETVTDRHLDLGPVAGLDALSAACVTPWLFTLPVDLLEAADDLLLTLSRTATHAGVFAQDDEGAQPLVALWRSAHLRAELDSSLPAQAWAIHQLQQRLGMTGVRFEGFRFGNLNTPRDIGAAGVVYDEG